MPKATKPILPSTEPPTTPFDPVWPKARKKPETPRSRNPMIVSQLVSSPPDPAPSTSRAMSQSRAPRSIPPPPKSLQLAEFLVTRAISMSPLITMAPTRGWIGVRAQRARESRARVEPGRRFVVSHPNVHRAVCV